MEKQQIFDLAAKASAGDEEAFKLLLKEKSRHILYNAYDYMKNHHDAEDAAQEIAMKMYRYIGNLKDPTNFNAWLHSIIRNVCISKLRKSKYYKNDLDVETIMDTSFSESLIEKDREFLPHAFAEDQSLSDALLLIIKGLPSRRRKTIILYYYEDLSQKEIAEIMGISESTVASNLLRARNDIKEKLKNEIGMDIEKEISTTTKPSAMPVLGQVLAADAIAHFGPESIEELTGMDFDGTADTLSQPPEQGSISSSLGMKITASVIATGVMCGGIFLAVNESSIPDYTDVLHPTMIEQPAALPADGEISFTGGDCECGHENPSVITLIYDESKVAGVLDYKWELLDSDNKVVADDEGIRIDTPSVLGKLSEGKYTAQFIVTDENGCVLKVERDFEIK